jgi:hypothetical protein
MGQGDAHGTARRIGRAAEIRDRSFTRQRFTASDTIVSSGPILAGGYVSRRYRGESFDPRYARIVKGGWNHPANLYAAEAEWRRPTAECVPAVARFA